MGETDSTIVDVYHEEEDFKINKTQLLAEIELQISKKQSKGSRASRGLLQQSRTSDDTSSLNQ